MTSGGYGLSATKTFSNTKMEGIVRAGAEVKRSGEKKVSLLGKIWW